MCIHICVHVYIYRCIFLRKVFNLCRAYCTTFVVCANEFQGMERDSGGRKESFHCQHMVKKISVVEYVANDQPRK